MPRISTGCFCLWHQTMQARETPHRDHPQRNGDRDDDGTAENIGELPSGRSGGWRVKMGMENSWW
jgi:hypothetical protein